MSDNSGRGRSWARSLPDFAAILTVTALVAVKCWNLVRPWQRQYVSGDFALGGVEPHFYHWLKRGVVLLWDPTVGTGSWLLGGGTHPRFPVISNLHLFYPPNLIGLGLAERDQSISYSALLGQHLFHYVLAGAFTYWYARVLRLDRFPALLSAIAFVFSGFMLAHFNHWTFIDAVAWLPAILGCLVRADETEGPGWGALAGAALGLALLAGAPQFAMYDAFAVAALALVLVGRRLATGRPWSRLVLACALVPLVAAGLAAVQLLPTWGVAADSYRARLGFDWKSVGSLAPSSLFQLALPSALRPLMSWPYDETYLYPGVVPAVLAGFALTLRWDWRVGFHAGLGLGALLLAFGDFLLLFRLAFDLVPGVAFFRIPARILVLVNFTVAILSGLGAHALLGRAEARGLGRFLGWTLGLTVAAAPAVYLLLLWGVNGSLGPAVEVLANEYVRLILLLLLTLAAVVWQARRATPGLVRAALFIALVLDLVFGSLALEGGTGHPDRVLQPERELGQFLETRPRPFRASLNARLRPAQIYRHGVSVVDGGSTFAPRAFLDLFFLASDNPRILDLLNVRYESVSGSEPGRPTAEPVGSVVLSSVALRRFALPSPRVVGRIEIDSYLSGGREVPEGATVATLHVLDDGGAAHAFPVRAGRETAEWTIDRIGRTVAHGKAPVARSWPMPEESYDAHSYRAAFVLPPRARVAQLVVERSEVSGALVIEQIRVDGERLASERPGRLVGPRLRENVAALPRAFLVRRVRRVAPERLMEELKQFDPAEEALLTGPVPDGWPAPAKLGPPLPPVTVAEHTPHRVRLETTVGEPAFLILSDTYDRGWRAWDNGRPVPILRADHALRGVPLGPGRHVVEFRYGQPAFWWGLAITGGTTLALAVGGVLGWRRRRGSARGATPHPDSGA